MTEYYRGIIVALPERSAFGMVQTLCGKEFYFNSIYETQGLDNTQLTLKRLAIGDIVLFKTEQAKKLKIIRPMTMIVQC